MIVCDTGPLVAAALANDRDHAACVDLFNRLHAAQSELLVPATVVAVVGYLLAREAGAHLESRTETAAEPGTETAASHTCCRIEPHFRWSSITLHAISASASLP